MAIEIKLTGTESVYDLLQMLHKQLLLVLLQAVVDPEVTPGTLNVARAFLKDNAVSGSRNNSKAIADSLEELLESMDVGNELMA